MTRKAPVAKAAVISIPYVREEEPRLLWPLLTGLLAAAVMLASLLL